MEDRDVWVCIDDDDSHHSGTDSDIIDSETEAELYSTIHYGENLNVSKPENENFITSGLFLQNSTSMAVIPDKDNLYTEEKGKHVNTELTNTFKSGSGDHDCLERNTKSQSFKNNRVSNGALEPSPPKKRKLSCAEESVILCSNDSEEYDFKGSSKYKLSNSVQSTSSCSTPNEKRSPKKVKNTPVVDSSDSDSIIWTESDSPIKPDFKTNLLKSADTTVYVDSSDTDEELPFLSSFKRRESILKNLSMPNIKVGEKSEGLWHINEDDLYRRKKYSRRYHEDTITCSNCNKKGHTLRICPVPKVMKCFICGGDHLSVWCMNRICSNCYEYGHNRKRCRRPLNRYHCSLCNIQGHTKENCPDLWRRYHLTTDPEKIVKGKSVKQDTNLYCWNCGDFGHFGGVCHMRSSGLTTWPCVVSYADPQGLLQQRLCDVQDRSVQMRLCDVQDRNVQKRLCDSQGRRAFKPWANCVKAQQDKNTPVRRKKVHLAQRNVLDTTEDLTERKAESKRKRNRRNKRKRMEMRLAKELLREHDFPRTPKQEISQIPQMSEVPQSVEILIKKRLKKKTKSKRKRAEIKQMKLNRRNVRNLQEVM